MDQGLPLYRAGGACRGFFRPQAWAIDGSGQVMAQTGRPGSVASEIGGRPFRWQSGLRLAESSYHYHVDE
jgi:hypothetical protein